MITIAFDQTKAPKEGRLSEALLLSLSEVLTKQIEKLPTGTIAAAIISDEEMQELNKTYRSKDKTTDVLSFSYLEDEDAESLGDVVISFNQAQRQAKSGVQVEVLTLLTHGILHVLGYDHETDSDAAIMLPIQDSIVEDLL